MKNNLPGRTCTRWDTQSFHTGTALTCPIDTRENVLQRPFHAICIIYYLDSICEVMQRVFYAQISDFHALGGGGGYRLWMTHLHWLNNAPF